MSRFVVLANWVPETIALWILHTYAYRFRDISTYLGIESPVHRCGKTTLLALLNQLARRTLTSANISSPAFFRCIEELRPTLLIDEADTFLKGNHELRGILNAGYTPDTGYVMRVVSLPSVAASRQNAAIRSEPSTLNSQLSTSSLARFSCWCPKAIARIGRLPETLADRCIIIRMHRKMRDERCERLRKLDPVHLKSKCLRWVRDNAARIAAAEPAIPDGLNDRAADIWEPLLVLADLAGGDWPQRARQAALGLAASTQEANPITALLLDIFCLFALSPDQRLFTRELVHGLNTRFSDRPWMPLTRGGKVTEIWLSQQLRPYGIRPKTLWKEQHSAKGYDEEDFHETFRRYIAKADYEAYLAGWQKPPKPGSPTGSAGTSLAEASERRQVLPASGNADASAHVPSVSPDGSTAVS